jgi:MoxR-like ATPase
MSDNTTNIRDARNLLGDLVKGAPHHHPIAHLPVASIKQGANGWNSARVYPFIHEIGLVMGLTSRDQVVNDLRRAIDQGTSVDSILSVLSAVPWQQLVNEVVASLQQSGDLPTINDGGEQVQAYPAPALPAVPAIGGGTPVAPAPVPVPAAPAGSTSAMKAMLAALTSTVAEAEKQEQTVSVEVAELRRDLTNLAQRMGKELGALAATAKTPEETPISAAALRGAVASAIKELAPAPAEVESAADGARELPDVPAVDPFYVRPPWHDDVAAFISADKHGVIGGSSGAGKTFPLKQICADLQRPCKLISANENLDAETLVSLPHIKGGTSSYHDGALTHAMRHGYVLIIDEGDDIRRGEALVLNDALESRQITIPQTGEVVKAKAGFCVWFTSNSIGDELGTYNREGFDESLRQRLLQVLAKPLTIDEEMAIMLKIVAPNGDKLTSDEAEKLVKWAHAARPLHFGINGNDPILKGLPSTRVLVSAAEIWLGFNRQTGATFPAMKRRKKDVRHSLWYAYAGALTSDEVGALKSVDLWIW